MTDKYLIVDIGAGTMDVLYFDEASGVHYKAVGRSPVLYMAEKAASLPGKVLITGCEMGGGPISNVLAERSQDADVIMSASSALTINHDLEKVRARGIKVVEDGEAERLRDQKGFSHLILRDVDVDRLKAIVEGLGVPFQFDVVGICAQDHGVPPEGLSHLDYRHNLFRDALDERPSPHALLYKNDKVPDTLNRLKSIAHTAQSFPTDEVYVMDSGMAAILGASMDHVVRSRNRLLVLDVATSHTLGAALDDREIMGFFEYHTQDVTLERLESLLIDLCEGSLEHERILREGGHGAYMRRPIGFKNVEAILATGPKRKIVENSRLPIAYGSPFGDNMMTGTVGVLEAIRRQKGLEPIFYV